MAPALGDPGRGRPAGGLPRLSARLRPAHARPPAADAGLSPGRPLRRGAPPLAGDAARAGRGPLLPRALRGARCHPAARSRGRNAGGRRAPGPRAGRSLLLPPGPHVSALDLRRAGGARRDAAGRLASRQPPAARQLPAPARPGGGHQRHRGRGDRHHPGAALARHGHRGRGGGRRDVPRAARRARARRARGAARPLPAPPGGRGDHRLGPRLAGRAPRRLEPLRGRARPHLRRALALRDPDRPHRASPPARHPLIEVIREPLAGGASAVKHAFDAGLAAVLILVTLPVMALVALAIRLTSRGPVLFFQERVGKDCRPFTMVKFRTMRVDAERKTGPVLASENDPRITWLGRYLRALRLDELPQLWNVLCGDMSFVGPRPERPEFVRDFERDIQGYAERFRVRPGLTGYAQVNGEYHTSAATKLKYDLAYIYNRSLWLDVRILADTVKVMLTQRGV